jgi:hypothetical protein
MAKEEREGPPAELFKKPKEFEHEDEVNEQNIFETGDAEDEVDEDALRRYQLERLRYRPPRYDVYGECVDQWCNRYYYAIVECDGPNAASHIFSELDGTELERSANVFNMSFVPDEMTFDQEFRQVKHLVDFYNADLAPKGMRRRRILSTLSSNSTFPLTYVLKSISLRVLIRIS